MTQGLETGVGQVPYAPEGVMDRSLEPDQPLATDFAMEGGALTNGTDITDNEPVLAGVAASEVDGHSADRRLVDVLSLETSLHMLRKAKGAAARIERKKHSSGSHIPEVEVDFAVEVGPTESKADQEPQINPNISVSFEKKSQRISERRSLRDLTRLVMTEAVPAESEAAHAFVG